VVVAAIVASKENWLGAGIAGAAAVYFALRLFGGLGRRA
jgi:hypothetical protein